MNYIGSKLKLSNFLKTEIQAVAGDISGMVFCDLFAGTGIVGRTFKPLTKSVIANDVEYYSYTLNRNYIGNNSSLNAEKPLEELNALPGIEGFIYKNYCAGSGSGRQYFSDENGRRIDAIRQQLSTWKTAETISDDLYFFLLSSLIEAADAVANTASVYGAFLKAIKKSAQKPLLLKPAFFEINTGENKVYNQDSNEIIKQIEGDILYLDPPYNARQYGSNYHLLNTIALYDEFIPSGKTGLRSYGRSGWCQKGKVESLFEDLIKNAQFKYIFLSYNNEGLMSTATVKRIMEKYGEYGLAQTNYQRFKADTDANRQHKADQTTEYLHYMVK